MSSSTDGILRDIRDCLRELNALLPPKSPNPFTADCSKDPENPPFTVTLDCGLWAVNWRDSGARYRKCPAGRHLRRLESGEQEARAYAKWRNGV